MAQLNRTAYKAKLDSVITTNGAEAITGALDNDLRTDQSDSFLNILSDADLLNLRDYSVSRTYVIGEACLYNGGGGVKLYRCIAGTGGTFDALDWEEVAGGGGGGASPLTTKGDIYTYDTADARLPIGTDGQVLKANSATATGLEWAAESVQAINLPVNWAISSGAVTSESVLIDSGRQFDTGSLEYSTTLLTAVSFLTSIDGESFTAQADLTAVNTYLTTNSSVDVFVKAIGTYASGKTGTTQIFATYQ